MKMLLRRNGLSLVLAGLFLLFWGAQARSGWHVYNDRAPEKNLPVVTFPAYLTTGHFWQATGENWESEFLQMGLYVVLTCFLYQKGSAESKDPDAAEEQPGPKKQSKFGFWYRNSLSLAFLALFLLSAVLHAAGSYREEAAEAAARGEQPPELGEFLQGPEFWFESFQNWQSEFLAVFSIVVLSIFLRQAGSPESKKVEAANSDTGSV